jgi:hypothetical protein
MPEEQGIVTKEEGTQSFAYTLTSNTHHKIMVSRESTQLNSKHEPKPTKLNLSTT